MTALQLAIALVVELALLGTIAGLAVRRRWRLSWFFSVYVLAVLTGNVLVTWWPQTFYVPWFWIAKEAVYSVLKLGIALELAARTFRVFPGARAVARHVLAALLVLTTAAVVTVSGRGLDYLATASDLHPRITNGTIWLLAATLAVAHWYRVPIHPFHSAVLAGLGAYLAVFSALLRLEALYGWAAQPYLNALDPPAYLLVILYWARSAWLPESALTRAHAETVHRVELRTASCG